MTSPYGFTAADLAPLDDDQKRAIMESLVVAVIAEGVTPRAEIEQFDREVEAIPWGLDRQQLILRLAAVRHDILALAGEERHEALIRSVGERIQDPALREKIFRAMCAIMFADDRLVEAETNVLGKYATAFAMSRDRLEAIRADVIASVTPPPRSSG